MQYSIILILICLSILLCFKLLFFVFVELFSYSLSPPRISAALSLAAARADGEAGDVGGVAVDRGEKKQGSMRGRGRRGRAKSTTASA